MKDLWYVLDENRQPRPATSWQEYAERYGGFETKRVAYTDLDDKLSVSTVFLGLDHSWGQGDPVLFETMVFRCGSGEECWRYCTWDAAQAGHEQVVAALREGKGLDDLDPPMGGNR